MQDKLIDFITHKISTENLGEIDSQDDLLGSGIIDSMGMMKLVVFIEKELDISIPDEDMTVENFMTLQNIMGYLSQRKDVDLNEA